MQTLTTSFNLRSCLRYIYKSFSVAALLLLTLIAFPRGGTIAHAHASLLSSEPANGAVVVEAPNILRLTFNEDVTLLETTRLTGPVGGAAYTANVKDGLVELFPQVPLIDGRWSIVWQVVSADGHLVGGVVSFVVGSESTPAEMLTIETKGAAYISETLVGGQVGAGTAGILDRILELLGWLAIIAALGAFIAGRTHLSVRLGVAAIFIPMLRVLDAFDRWGLSAWLIGETRAGLVVALAGVFLLVAALQPRRIKVTLLFLAVLTWSMQAFFSGHPNVIDPKPLYAAFSALHLAGALTWSAAVIGVFLNSNRAQHASRIATVGVALLLPGAVLLVTAFVPAAFVNGAGRWEGILAAKATLVLGALLLGWRNHRDVRRTDFEKGIPPNLRRRTGAELALIILIAFLSATLTTSVPARVVYTGVKNATGEVSSNVSSTNDANVKENTDVNKERTQVRKDLVFENGETGEILLEIATDGSTLIHLVLRDSDGNPFIGEQVEYDLENQDLAIVGITGELPVNGGMHMGETVIPGQGTWRMSVYVTYETFTTISATIEIIVEETGK